MGRLRIFLMVMLSALVVGMAARTEIVTAKKSSERTEEKSEEKSGEKTADKKETEKKNGWIKKIYSSGAIRYKYKKKNAYIKNKIIKIKKKYYYFDKKGICRTGWIRYKGAKYFFDRSKRYAMVGKKQVGSLYYIFDSKGQLIEEIGLYQYKSGYYYLSEKVEGAIETGWKLIDNSWHYFSTSTGKMYTGKKKIDNEVHYFTDTGAAYYGIYIAAKYKYFYDSLGKRIVSAMIDYEGKSYYADEKGHLVTGLYVIEGRTYFFNEESERVTGFVDIGEDRRYFGADGVLLAGGAFTDNGNTYFAEANGDIVRNRWIDGKFYDYEGKQTESVIDFTEKDVSYITDEVLDELNLAKCTKLMVVAHPDDEVLWGGAELAEGGYFVLCLTNGNSAIRKAEFMKVMEQSGNTGMILSYPDTVAGVRSDWKKEMPKIAHDLQVLLTYKKWGKIVTHNPAGEYGHIHHKMTNKLVTQTYYKNYDLSDLYYFEIHYSKNQIDKMQNTLQRISDELLKKKLSYFEIYVSQKECVSDHSYLAAYENLVRADDWQ